MDGPGLLATVHVAPSAASPLLLIGAFGLCGGLWAANQLRHPDRSILSTAAIVLGCGLAGFFGLLIVTARLLAVFHEPYPDSVLLCLAILLFCTQMWLAMEWITSPPKRWGL